MMLRLDSDNRTIAISEADNSSSDSDKPNHFHKTPAKKTPLPEPPYGLGVIKPSETDIDDNQYYYHQPDPADNISILPSHQSSLSSNRTFIDDNHSLLGDPLPTSGSPQKKIVSSPLTPK